MNNVALLMLLSDFKQPASLSLDFPSLSKEEPCRSMSSGSSDYLVKTLSAG